MKGQKFDLVVCAGAPAIMWAANANPQADMHNLQQLADAICSADIGCLVLISTIGVFDDVSAGYTESNANFEKQSAYGLNRRELEVELASKFHSIHIIRLPALFGSGLKKNFIFDILNPEPSFIKPAKFDSLLQAFPAKEGVFLQQAYCYNSDIDMWAYKRDEYKDSKIAKALIEAFWDENFLATQFTNSQSRFQYYNLEKLADDIDRMIAHDINVLNICSAPAQAGEIYRFLTGKEFNNTEAAAVNEDVRSDHTDIFGTSGHYLYEKYETLNDLRRFCAEFRDPE
ncbi:NAD-dependent epimerase/dehydratase family protein [Parasphingorhabdus litoris]|nr:sugar nucleotide-binding protein [Parasphingorhabdus litoris]